MGRKKTSGKATKSSGKLTAARVSANLKRLNSGTFRPAKPK
jgi:hypothetical protein